MTTTAGPTPRVSTVEHPESKSRLILADFLERAGWSAGQVFFAALLAGGTAVAVANLPWKYASVLALGTAVASVVLTAIQYLAKATNLPFWTDLLVRLGKTFLVSLAGSFAAAHPFDVHEVRLNHGPEPCRPGGAGGARQGVVGRGQWIRSRRDRRKRFPESLYVADPARTSRRSSASEPAACAAALPG